MNMARLITADCVANVIYMGLATFIQSPWTLVGQNIHSISLDNSWRKEILGLVTNQSFKLPNSKSENQHPYSTSEERCSTLSLGSGLDFSPRDKIS